MVLVEVGNTVLVGEDIANVRVGSGILVGGFVGTQEVKIRTSSKTTMSLIFIDTFLCDDLPNYVLYGMYIPFLMFGTSSTFLKPN